MGIKVDERASAGLATATGAQSAPFARFWKCALQVNPEGYSKTYRGRDHGLEGESFLAALLAECQTQEVSLIGIADHGSVADVDAIAAYLAPHGIVVLPGFEICTTEKVHWVCLFPEDTSIEQLNRYLGHLRLLDPEDGIRPSSLGGEELLIQIASMGGFCYAAHISNERGLLRTKANHLWKNPLLVAAQIPGAIADLPEPFRKIVTNRDPAYGREHPLALINAKDVAAPEDLGDPSASCYIKMTRPGFDALCVAFKDPESRVRLQSEMREAYSSRLEYMRIEGGYLAGTEVYFSPHLNALIGGRGTGKSTLVECLRYALGLEYKTEQARKQGDAIIKENFGKDHGQIEIVVVSSSQQMLRYRIVRRYGEAVRVLDPEGNESSLTVNDLLPGVDVYGQNEIYDLARDENALIRVLDHYLPDRGEYEKVIATIKNKLKVNAQRLTSAWEKHEELASQLQRLPGLEEQVKQFDAIGFTEKLKLVPLLERERQLPARIAEEVSSATEYLESLQESVLDTSFLDEDEIESLPNADTLRQARKVIEKAGASIERRVNAVRQDLAKAVADLAPITKELEVAQRAAEKALEKEFKKLPSVGGRDGPALARTYRKLQAAIAAIRPKQRKLGAVAKSLQSLEKERLHLLRDLSALRSTRSSALEKEVKRLNKKLIGKLRLSVVPNANREQAKDFLSRVPGIGAKGVAWMENASDLTISALAEACRTGAAALQATNWGITASKAEILSKLDRATLLALEIVDLEDRVLVELNVAHSGETFRPLSRLSTGQQCTAILHLLLLDDRGPLVMDQPEDNLDNAFIADRIVQELRVAKTTRQFLFATHNANIPVFGDAEWIGVFTATDDHGSVPLDRQGSIDAPIIRDEAARILDGGREAFRQRQQKYGY